MPCKGRVKILQFIPLRGMKAKDEYHAGGGSLPPFVDGEASMDSFFLKYPLRGRKQMKNTTGAGVIYNPPCDIPARLNL